MVTSIFRHRLTVPWSCSCITHMAFGIFHHNSGQYLALTNRAGGLNGRILTQVISTDRMQWGLYIQPRPRFSYTGQLNSVNKMFITWQKQEQLTLNDWSRGEQWILFPKNLNVSRDEVERNIEIRGKQNSLFPKGPVIKWFVIQYRSNVSWQSLEARYSKLDSRSSILENFKDRGSSRVSRRSRPFENLSRPFENLSSRVSRLSSGKNKGLFARLTFDTSEYFFTGRSILTSGPY